MDEHGKRGVNIAPTLLHEKLRVSSQELFFDRYPPEKLLAIRGPSHALCSLRRISFAAFTE